MREIEVKVRTHNLEEVAQKLADLGWTLSAPIKQYDTIYSRSGGTSVWEESKEGNIVLRIRRENESATFNLKLQRSNELDNIEYETQIEDADAMHQILLALGYTPQVEVRKTRRKGKLQNYEICLDEVEKLGGFVELEKLADDAVNPVEVQEELFQILEPLGFSRENQEMRGYDTQVFQLEHKKLL